MATKNPKISVYVSDELKEKLLEAKELRRSHSLSSVVVEILEEYFSISQQSISKLSNAWVEQTNARLEVLESQIQELLKRPEDRKAANTSKKEETLGINTGEPKQCSLLEDQSNAEETQHEAVDAVGEEAQLLSTAEVSQLIGIGRSTLNEAKRKGNLPKEWNDWQIIRCIEKHEAAAKGILGNAWEIRRLKS
ncbi:MAG TPA: hypothetical protein V6C65_34380 [Allocoleopsis sp.]